MRLYTVIYTKNVKQVDGSRRREEFYVSLFEAETTTLACHAGFKRCPKGHFGVFAEEGDTRALHPNTQDLIFLPAQVDISEVVG